MNKNLDSMGIGKALELFPEQIKTTYGQAMASNIQPLEFKSVVISGMGGSSNAGKIIQSILEPELKIPFVVYNDYGLPAWVNERTFVVLNSYSGNTEETLSAFDAYKGTRVIGVTTGGKIAEMIKSGIIKGVIVDPKDTNPSKYPKSGLGISFGALFGALTKVGLLKTSKEELYSALDELVENRKSWNTDELAKWLYGYLPVLFCGRPFIGALNAGRNAMCELSRQYTQFYDFPEVNHVMVEGIQKPKAALNNRYLFFESKFLHARVKTRFEITERILGEMGLHHKTYNLQLASKVGQSLELAHLCAWVGYKISLLRGEDPGPEPWLIKIKKSLSQPIH